MQSVGLTGPLGAGKTTIAGWLEQWGATCVRADEIGHRLLEPETPVHKEVCRRYGSRVCLADGRIDRKALGRVVFGEPEELRWYNALAHPHLLARLRDEIHQRRREPGILVVDAALLYEWGIEQDFDRIVLVTADPTIRFQRVRDRDGLDAENFTQRDKAQHGPQPGRRRPDFIITNHGDTNALQRQVWEVWSRLQERDP